MKTIENGCREYLAKRNLFVKETDYSCKYYPTFKAGVEFAQQMQSFEEEKPEYYTPVIVEYNDSNVIAWLAWSDEWGYVWTVNGADVWFEHKQDIKWRHINIK